VDARAGVSGRARPSSVVVFGPNDSSCATTVTLRANPQTVTRGSSVQLSLIYTRAKHITLKNSTGSVTLIDQDVLDEATPRTLTASYTLSQSERFIATATGCSNVTSFVDVGYTIPCPTINSFVASAYQITPGQAVTISWNVSNVNYPTDKVLLNGSPVSTNPDQRSSGSVTVNPTQTTTYTLQSDNGSSCPDTKSLTIIVCPQIQSFTASQTTVPFTGADVTFSWNIIGVDANSTLKLNGSPVAASGSVTQFVSATTTFTLSASGPGGCSDQRSITVTVGSAQPTPSPTATPPGTPTPTPTGTPTPTPTSCTTVTDNFYSCDAYTNSRFDAQTEVRITRSGDTVTIAISLDPNRTKNGNFTVTSNNGVVEKIGWTSDPASFRPGMILIPPDSFGIERTYTNPGLNIEVQGFMDYALDPFYGSCTFDGAQVITIDFYGNENCTNQAMGVVPDSPLLEGDKPMTTLFASLFPTIKTRCAVRTVRF
jgi:hypothetical protein